MKIIKILMVFLYWAIYTATIPICLVVSLAIRLKIGFPKSEQDDFQGLSAFSKSDFDKLNLSLNGEGQDQCKFYGMRYYSTQKSEDWHALYNGFVDETNFLFHRGYGFEDMSFSGDMYTGIAIATATSLQNNHVTAHQRTVLAKCFENITYGSYIPFRQPHSDISRGYQSMPPICNGMAINTLSILKLGATFNTGGTKWLMNILYVLFLLSSLPCLLFGAYDRFFWWYRLVGIFAYNTHSDCVLYKACEILGMPFARKGLNQLYKVHGSYNIDIQMLSGYYQPNNIKMHLSSLLESRSKDFIGDEYITVFDIKNFRTEQILKELPSSKRCETHTWEKFGSRGNPKSNKSNFDIEFAYNILTK